MDLGWTKSIDRKIMNAVSPTQQTFLIVNGLIVTLVVLSFFLMRKGPRPPVKLDLTSGKSHQPRDKAPTSTKPAVQSQGRPVTSTDYRPRQGQLIDQDGETSPGRAPRGASSPFNDADTSPGREPQGGEISLNVLFNWNGHTWDAYEVLGLPAGSSRDKAAAAFQAARAKADPESIPFLQAAFEAITRG